MLNILPVSETVRYCRSRSSSFNGREAISGCRAIVEPAEELLRVEQRHEQHQREREQAKADHRDAMEESKTQSDEIRSYVKGSMVLVQERANAAESQVASKLA